MKTHRHSTKEGNVLLVTVTLLAMVCAFSGIALEVTRNASQNTTRSADHIAAQAAAEGALEYAYAIWTKRIGRGQFATEHFNEELTPPPLPNPREGVAENIVNLSPLVSYADEDALTVMALDAYGVPTATGVPITGRVPGYVGWSGRTRNYVATARMKLSDGSIIGVRRLFQYTEVPLFQSMFFFQHDLEFYRPAEMIVNGLMHTNSKMYISTDPNTLTIQGNVTYTQSYHDQDSPSARYWTGGYQGANWKGSPPIWAIGKDAQLNQVPAIQPMGGSPEEVFDRTDRNPNNDGYRELIEPSVRGHDDPEAIASRRLVNKASIVIEINGTNSVTVTPKGDVVLANDKRAAIASAVTKVQGHPERTEWKNGKWETIAQSGIRDAREANNNQSGWVDVSTVNIAAIKDAVSGVIGFNHVIYIHDTTPRTSSDPEVKAIRLINGEILPNGGLTIASENPVYVQGDYNTGKNPRSSTHGNPNNDPALATATNYERKPAAIIADAVMLLSNNWKDVNSNKALNSRSASHTTYNMAILAGFQPSTNNSFSGGANNFPRFLEHWQNKYCTYFGSMVELFESEMFQGKWDTGAIYYPPLRRWNFDSRFLTTPPPGSVEAVVLNRGPWSRF